MARSWRAEPDADPAYQAIVAAPGFCLGVRCSASAIERIAFLPAQAECAPANPLAATACAQLRAYLADPEYRFDLPLQTAGTPFQRLVWQEIAAIPVHQTKSYGQIARAVHSAARAVGQACGANPYPVVVPCHRVLAAQGGLGGFARQSGGFLLEVKRWLLAHEAG
ncbi:MAG TPA: methylated-DNA--[protein]-cysteine S-methyltransferase [Accumulibacter sp.]|uniref:methylated-DNA--[protein]-cysteine S-methyltransferase n=1 Tax=Accumulibacter sp. TaxID=2053492 RepID=UPI002878B216|nr:methylated-DNA--[protein]-cysteine S-methyltransferase [Accumulibacter sp.]MDS4013176.1 methylated-DNA--[protein]-cysteine S-methyltransferase [Accumulibacter sp.]MDS4055275.1 methylated-DNA--[protein]-cysteine S-methyltransferase [Accumulibacter sp.]HMV06013.1 methylated-DNA--[protein]-cysteine S-methyltransferase [Accumulibacter sp.]HMW81107.1 methylated-DNA--[protein]-cysteine S-methyltransferase [Accumulibacter sp.]HMX68900.1 methylated-DNA--[protein]-cysteine S-methyltransferase [Accum